MLEDESMETTLERLVDIQEEKPLEYVGSRAEINTAVVTTIDRVERDGEDLPLLLSYYKGTGLCDRYKEEGNQYSSYYDGENLVSEPWLSLVKEQCVSGPVTA